MLSRLFKLYERADIAQDRVFRELIKGGERTGFGCEHGFSRIRNISDFQRCVPLRDYDALEPYILRQMNGEDYVLWNQKCRYYAQSSGTSSSKSKFIPVTPDCLRKCHFRGFKMMLAGYVAQNPHTRLYKGKSLTIAGTLDYDGTRGIAVGDLSGILTDNSPRVAELLRAPSKDIALIKDFDTKIRRVNEKYCRTNVVSISGVPSWNLLMIERLLEMNGAADLCEIWPNMELFMHGGTGFGPYRAIFERLIPSERMHYLENYNASEGYFAFQDDMSSPGMLLTLNNGVLYEFVPVDRLDDALCGKDVNVETIESVRKDVDYALVITTNAGLWRYVIGDTVRFVSLDPPRIVISGRVKVFINAFGEELMIANADAAIARACEKFNVQVREYTVAPVFMSVDSDNMTGAHQWVVEFVGVEPPAEDFADFLDSVLQEVNSDYEAKRTHTHTMRRLSLEIVPKGTFLAWMSSRNKLGGQNKVPRLSNDRKYVESILEFVK